jgi:hypothetical protein
MTFTDEPEPPANPERGHVWRRPDRVWWVWDDERSEWRLIRDFGRMAA